MSSTTVTFEAPQELIATVDEIASARSVDRAIILRDALAEYIAEYEDIQADFAESERQFAAGETVPHQEMVAWLRSRNGQIDKPEAAWFAALV